MKNIKQILLVLAGLWLVIGASAQPTINQLMDLEVGDKYWMKPGGTGISTSMITHGANQIWDFSNLPTNAEPIASICVDPSSTPYADSVEVQNSNIAIKPYGVDEDTIFNYQFLRLGNTNKESMAMGLYHNYDKVSVGYTKWLDPFIGMKVPMTFGDSYNDRQILWMYNIAQAEPILKDTSEITVAAVGYGTVKTPAGTFENALLFKETVHWIWWNKYGGPSYKTEGTDINYQWRVPGIKLSVLSVCIPDGVGGMVTYLWKTEFNSGGIENPDDNDVGDGDDDDDDDGDDEPFDPSGIWLNTSATAGGYLEKSNGSLCWTMGEAVVETFQENMILSQGFNQPSDVVVSSNEIEMETTFILYPNPTTTVLNIEVSNLKNSMQAALISITGQVMKVFTIQQNITQLNTEQLQPGAYFVRIICDDTMKTFTLIKK